MSSATVTVPRVRKVPALSPREFEVLRVWLLTGSKDDAARSLFIAPTTLNTHLSRIRDKYTAVGRTATSMARLLICALQDGIVHLDEFDDDRELSLSA